MAHQMDKPLGCYTALLADKGGRHYLEVPQIWNISENLIPLFGYWRKM